MTIKELIEHLNKYPSDTVVTVWSAGLDEQTQEVFISEWPKEKQILIGDVDFNN